MKKSMVLIVILLMALVLVGCKSTTPTPEPPTQAPIPPTSIPAIPTQTTPPDTSWQTIQQSGVLRVGTTADYPPFEYFDGNYQLTGFDIALIQAIGQRLGLKVEIGSYAWDSLPATVAIGQVDVAISAISVTRRGRKSQISVMSTTQARMRYYHAPMPIRTKSRIQNHSLQSAWVSSKTRFTKHMPSKT